MSAFWPPKYRCTLAPGSFHQLMDDGNERNGKPIYNYTVVLQFSYSEITDT